MSLKDHQSGLCRAAVFTDGDHFLMTGTAKRINTQAVLTLMDERLPVLKEILQFGSGQPAFKDAALNPRNPAFRKRVRSIRQSAEPVPTYIAAASKKFLFADEQIVFPSALHRRG